MMTKEETQTIYALDPSPDEGLPIWERGNRARSKLGMKENK